jgi:tungstate transport system ATP-binding protein
MGLKLWQSGGMADSLPLKQPALSLHELRYSVGDTPILQPLSLQIQAGTRTVVLGPNGAGKSVFLRLVHGLLPSLADAVKIGNADPFSVQSMVFQRPVMLRRSVLDNVRFALEVAGSAGDTRARAMQALQLVGLSHLAGKPARRCSGGEQQRIALARAWCVRPAWILLDEPCANLDPGATRQVEAIVQQMHEQGASILMTTHDLGQARRLADRILFLHRGRLLEDAPAERFFTAPAAEQARAFIKGELVWD